MQSVVFEYRFGWSVVVTAVSIFVAWAVTFSFLIPLQHCNSQGIPITSPPKNSYPWSPRWEVTEMVERI